MPLLDFACYLLLCVVDQSQDVETNEVVKHYNEEIRRITENYNHQIRTLQQHLAVEKKKTEVRQRIEK